MTFASDDLTPNFLPPDREFAGYGQAILLDFDNDSFENRVSYRGGVLTNLPVMDRIGALTYKAGDVVLLMRWRPTGGGLAVPWIAGAPVIPGAGRGEAAVEFLRGALAKQISAEVFEARIKSAFEPGEEFQGDTDSDFITLTGGPTVTDVEVTATGTALIWIDCRIITGIGVSSTGESTGEASPHITGATTVAAGTLDRKEFGQVRGTADFQHNLADRSSTLFIATDLNPGIHSIEVRYRVLRSDGGLDVRFARRGIAVIAL